MDEQRAVFIDAFVSALDREIVVKTQRRREMRGS